MKHNSIMLNPTIDNQLKEIVAKRKFETGLLVTKKGIVAELIFNAYKKEVGTKG